MWYLAVLLDIPAVVVKTVRRLGLTPFFHGTKLVLTLTHSLPPIEFQIPHTKRQGRNIHRSEGDICRLNFSLNV